MAIYRGSMVVFLMALLVCAFLIKMGDANPNAEPCTNTHGEENQRCNEEEHVEEDDFDDTYKIVNNVRISSPFGVDMIVLGH
ncbi:hypothetical protein SLA2020_049970 [Shorea laevis]